jgi:hypothetical protein
VRTATEEEVRDSGGRELCRRTERQMGDPEPARNTTCEQLGPNTTTHSPRGFPCPLADDDLCKTYLPNLPAYLHPRVLCLVFCVLCTSSQSVVRLPPSRSILDRSSGVCRVGCRLLLASVCFLGFLAALAVTVRPVSVPDQPTSGNLLTPVELDRPDVRFG